MKIYFTGVKDKHHQPKIIDMIDIRDVKDKFDVICNDTIHNSDKLYSFYLKKFMAYKFTNHAVKLNMFGVVRYRYVAETAVGTEKYQQL